MMELMEEMQPGNLRIGRVFKTACLMLAVLVLPGCCTSFVTAVRNESGRDVQLAVVGHFVKGSEMTKGIFRRTM